MNFLSEKEKKLNEALTKLKNLNFKDPNIKKNIENLKDQKNQLKIEKCELEEKYKDLVHEHEKLGKKLSAFESQEKIESLVKVVKKSVAVVKKLHGMLFSKEVVMK